LNVLFSHFPRHWGKLNKVPVFNEKGKRLICLYSQ